MIFRIYVVIFGFVMVSSSYAMDCRTLQNHINADLFKYGDNIKAQNLPWMQLKWLKKNFGPAMLRRISPQKMTLTWQCNQENLVTVDVDAKGVVTHIKSQYSDVHGAGLLETCLNTGCNIISTQILYYQHLYPAGRELACQTIASEIHKLGQRGHREAADAYPFENSLWLDQTLGKPTVAATSHGNISTYDCPDKINSVMYMTSKDGSPMISSVYCIDKQCTLSTLTRNGNAFLVNRVPIHNIS